MPETFTDDDENEFEDVEDLPPQIGGGRRKRGDKVPDGAVENADDLPLLTHAGTGKANTVTYLKVTRLDGPKGVRGLKGQMAPSSTVEDVARRYGNGAYKIEGCNAKHKVLAREEALEIAMGTDYDTEDQRASTQPQQPGGPSPQFALHSMKMVTDMANQHQDTLKETTASSSEQVREMATRTMEMLTAFTAAQRESERSSHEASQANQQQFFATMMAMSSTAHAQQMEMLTAMHERGRKSELDPMAMVQMFMDGIKAGGDMGGGGPEPWVAALKEGTGMMGHLANLANAPAVTAHAGQQGGQKVLPPAPRSPRLGPPSEAGQEATTEPKRKRRLPFNREEVRSMAKLKAALRQRGIPLNEFLAQTTTYYQEAPDSELFDGAGDDGPVASEKNAGSSDTTTEKTPEPDPQG